MRNIFKVVLAAFLLLGCDSDNAAQTGCDLDKALQENGAKVTITNGIWGTVSSMEGNCMPIAGGGTNSCRTCPVQRTIRLYEYTLQSQATQSTFGPFYDSFNTALVAEVNSDENGFYQIDIPAGHYSFAIVENGKLYVSGMDGDGGLNPVTVTSGAQRMNILMTHKAVF